MKKFFLCINTFFIILFFLNSNLVLAKQSTEIIYEEKPLDLTLEEIKNNIENNINIIRDDLYSRELRKFFRKYEDGNDEKNLFKVLNLLQLMKQKLRSEFKQYAISDEEYKEAGYSIGAALKGKIDNDELLAILLREAKMLSMGAQVLLRILYSHGYENFEKHNPSILCFFKMQANEGFKRGKLEYGRILFYGIGTAQNKRKGIKLIEASELSDGYMELATYYYNNNISDKFEHYLRLAASKNDDPKACYNLGILEQKKKNYIEAIKFFEKTLEINSEYYEALLELARMYTEGWGIEKNTKYAISLMEKIIKNSDDEVLKKLAIENIKLIKESNDL